METVFFKSAPELRDWLAKNHDKVTEVSVGFYKKSSGRTGITYQEALDEALCFGWIDGVRKGLDETSYKIRFTPRKAKSIWSNINIKRVGELKNLGRLEPAGLQTFEKRDAKRSGIYAFENEVRKLDAASEKALRANKKAWEFFRAQAPWYQRNVSWWITSAKKEETRVRRIELLIKDSEQGRRLRQYTSPGKKTK
jgi:uncharacterized protein YdeI (YjbR/CyaY-like superfamily)